jgi:hypothetical protein
MNTLRRLRRSWSWGPPNRLDRWVAVPIPAVWAPHTNPQEGKMR